jgi:hypothetical protein
MKSARFLSMVVFAMALAGMNVVNAADNQPSSTGLTPPGGAYQPPWLTGRLGLKPQTPARPGLSYHYDTRSLLIPMDQDDSWRLGFGFNIGGEPKSEALEQGGGLGLQYRGTPGIIFQKKF